MQSSKTKNVQLVNKTALDHTAGRLLEPCTQPLCIPELGKHVFYATPSGGVIFSQSNSAAIMDH